MTDLAPGQESAVARRTRRAPSLRVCVGSPAGLWSRMWSVTAAGAGPRRRVEIRPGPGPWVVTHTTRRDGWQVRVPGDTAEQHGLSGLPQAPVLAQEVAAVAPGWHVGLVLLIPRIALTRPGPPGTAGTTLPAPERGRCAQVTVMLGEPDAAPLALGPAQDAGAALTEDGARVQLLAGQATLVPELARHLVRTRQHLAECALPEPRRPAFVRLRTVAGLDVVADLGAV